MLPPNDHEYLTDRVPGHQVSLDGGMIAVLIPSFSLPPGLNLAGADLLLRLSPGYPDIAPDMWWFSPDVFRANGSRIPATEVHETHLGRQWQRWSRHFNPGQWRAGLDCLESFLALVRKDLQIAARGIAA